MSFTDRYSITEFSQNPKQRFSLSIDEHKDTISPVLLVVPDTDLADHDHIVIETNKIFELKNFLNTKGQVRFDSGRYSLVINEFSLKQEEVTVEVHEKESPTGFKVHKYSLALKFSALEEIKKWISQFEKLSKSELIEKYQKDLKRI